MKVTRKSIEGKSKVSKVVEDARKDEETHELLEQETQETDEVVDTFASLGLVPELVEACIALGFKSPTQIQLKSIPIALEGRDLIGLAQTGSGKTAAFALPILNSLWLASSTTSTTTASYGLSSGVFACVLAPTRELAIQIGEQFDALGAKMGVRVSVIVGGMDMMAQSISLSRKPHVIVCTPGRLVDHLENTKGFNLKNLKFLVLDEADRLLDLDFGVEIEKVLAVIPRERNTYLFSATMTSKVEKLQRASLVNPQKLEISTKYSTVSSLLQYYLFFPFKHKECYLVYLMNEMAGQTVIVFTLTVMSCMKLSLMLRTLGFEAVCLHGQMPQPKRLGALTQFKSGTRNILIATDVASRGLDIPDVDLVINYDVPQSSKDYIHRVGRTARAGKPGKSITLVTQYDIEWYTRIEHAIGKKLVEFPLGREKGAVLVLQERVAEAVRIAHVQVKEEQRGRGDEGEVDGSMSRGGRGGRGGGRGRGRGRGKRT